MGLCNSSNNKIHSKRRFSTNRKAPDEYAALSAKFQKEIKSNAFYSCNSSNLQEKLISQFVNSNKTPNNFISTTQTGKYSTAFKKQFMLSYLKSEPLLNNIFPSNEKEAGLLFFNISLFMLSSGSTYERKTDLANKLIMESFDHSLNKHNLEKLKDILRNVINVSMILCIYFGALFLFLNEDLKTRIFVNDENIQVDKRYDVAALDSYFFDNFQSIQKEMNDELFISIWEEFLCMPFGDGNANGKPSEEKNRFVLLSKDEKDEIKFRLCHMFDSTVFFEVFLKLQVPTFNIAAYTGH